MIEFTIITNALGPACKIFAMDGDALKTTSAANIAVGSVRTTRVADLKGFLTIRAKLKSNEALIYGVTGKAKAELRTKSSPEVLSGQAIARDLASFQFRTGKPAIMFYDFDPKPGRPKLGWRELDAIYGEALPGFAATRRAWVPSSSAYLYLGEREMIGPGGWRCYQVVDDGAAIPRIMAAMYIGLWRLGHGFIGFDDNGRRHGYALTDPCVAEANRLDFAAAPIMRDGLTRRAPAPVILDGAPMLATAGIQPGMKITEWSKRDRAYLAAWNAAKPESDKRNKVWIAGKVAEDVAAGVDRGAAERKWKAAVRGCTLDADFLLTLTDGSVITVREILAEPGRWDKATCHDPLDPHRFNDGREAQIYAHDRRLHSFVNNTLYFLEGSAEQIAAQAVKDFAGVPINSKWKEEPKTVGKINARALTGSRGRRDMSGPKEIAAAIKKLSAIKPEKWNTLFAAKTIGAMATIKEKARPDYENLIDKWRTLGFKKFTALDQAVNREIARRKRAEKEAAKAEPSEEPLFFPMAAARRFRDEIEPTLIHYRDEWLRHQGSHYVQVEPKAIRGGIWQFLDTADDGTFQPDGKSVSYTLDALTGLCLIERDAFKPPCWIDPKPDDPPAHEILACKNGLLHLPSGMLLPHTPRFFTRNGLPFDYNAKAAMPKAWIARCAELWNDDPEQITLLQEIFGYLLTPDTTLQRIFLMFGPPASGRGTIVRILTKLVGKENTCSPTLSHIGTRFGFEHVIDKQIATISDMRLGKNADRHEIVGNLLRISGEDYVDVERKGKGGAITTQLPIRILIVGNLLPALPDETGALKRRFVTLMFDKSFEGREDRSIDAKLEAELPGILNWSIEGWRRLKAQGDFTATRASTEMKERLEELSSRLRPFIEECCILDKQAVTPKRDLYEAYFDYALRNDGLGRYGERNFHHDLIAATGYKIHEVRIRIDEETESESEGVRRQVRAWKGIKLRKIKDDRWRWPR